ncbi:hypothetical protein CDAR_246831, partial [Caerostris darwini]
MSSISVRDCSLPLCGNLCAGMSSTSCVLYLCEYPLPLCGNVLYLCAGLFSTFVRQYPLPRCVICVMSSISVQDCSLPLCGNILYLGIYSISVRDCSLSLCGNILYLCRVLYLGMGLYLCGNVPFVREYPLYLSAVCPLSLCGIVLLPLWGISSTSVRIVTLCGNHPHLLWECPLSLWDCSLPLCGNNLYLSGCPLCRNVIYLCAVMSSYLCGIGSLLAFICAGISSLCTLCSMSSLSLCGIVLCLCVGNILYLGEDCNSVWEC